MLHVFICLLSHPSQCSSTFTKYQFLLSICICTFICSCLLLHSKKEKSHSHGISNILIFKNRSLSGVSSFINAICYPIIQHVQFNYNKCHSRGVIIQVNSFSRSKGFEIPKWYFRGCFADPF